MVDVTVDRKSDSDLVVKLQTETWELNIYAPAADFIQLQDIENAD